MANTLAPNGFQQFQGTGTTPSYEQTTLAIASGNTVPIFAGDPVVQATGTTGIGTGYIAQAAPPVSLAVSGIVVTAGVAVATFAAQTFAPAVGSTVVFSNTTATAVGLANVGQNIGFYLNSANNSTSPTVGNGGGNTMTGISGAYADQYSLSANSPQGYYANAVLPFRVVSLFDYVPGATSPLVSINGADPTTAYNKIVVGFNNAMPNRPGAGI